MMLRLTLLGTAAAIATMSFGSHAPHAPAIVNTVENSHCDTTGGRGISLRNYIVPIVTGVGSGADRGRATSSLPSGTASIVTVVTNDSVCTAAYLAQVQLKHNGDSTLVGPIALLQVGSNRYVIEDISRRAGEWTVLDIYDTNLNYIASITR